MDPHVSRGTRLLSHAGQPAGSKVFEMAFPVPWALPHTRQATLLAPQKLKIEPSSAAV